MLRALNDGKPMINPKPMQSYDRIDVTDEGTFVNNRPASRELRDAGIYSDLREIIALPHSCPFCDSVLMFVGNDSRAQNSEAGRPLHEDGSEQYTNHALWYCRRCRFWQWYYFSEGNAEQQKMRQFSDGCPPEPEHFACISKIRDFSTNLPPVCSSELAQYLRRHPAAWHKYDPHRFEKLVADILRANYSNAEVIHVGRPDDGGVDILFVDTDKEQWLVQVKRREKEHSTEGVSTIRNLIGTMVLENAVRGVVISTADHFTLRARQAADNVNGRGLYIELVDKGVLDRMLEPVLPDRPWLPIVKAHSPDLADVLSQKVASDHQFSLF